MTAVRFSAEEPYGKAIALFNLKSNLVKVDEEWFVMPGIVLTVILLDLLRKEGYAAFVATGDDLGSKTEVMVLDKTSAVAPGKGGLCGRCGGGCGGSCGNNLKSSRTNGVDTKSSGCGGCGGCGGSCGNKLKGSSTKVLILKAVGVEAMVDVGEAVKTSCGSGCSDDIKSTPRNRNDTKSSGCGRGCSNDIKSSLKTGNDIKSSGYAGCGSSCRNDIKSNARNGNDIKSSGCAGCSGCGGEQCLTKENTVLMVFESWKCSNNICLNACSAENEEQGLILQFMWQKKNVDKQPKGNHAEAKRIVRGEQREEELTDMEQFCANFAPLLEENHKFLASIGMVDPNAS
ncbi:hypothetical protein ACLOJK_015951 [Asimina triloba]